jgi:hypothetical protein
MGTNFVEKVQQYLKAEYLFTFLAVINLLLLHRFPSLPQLP